MFNISLTTIRSRPEPIRTTRPTTEKKKLRFLNCPLNRRDFQSGMSVGRLPTLPLNANSRLCSSTFLLGTTILNIKASLIDLVVELKKKTFRHLPVAKPDVPSWMQSFKQGEHVAHALAEDKRPQGHWIHCSCGRCLEIWGSCTALRLGGENSQHTVSSDQEGNFTEEFPPLI